ncbi:phosphopantetheine-binding protein [Micromonospora chaiyaphumensis]|jgi:peptidyl carrier protein|uniref:Phosphopantetheine attachment site n=1 Tax=Micromonospora chaiyaphumensis TaxID=307119 RepID=A0A1C4W0C8_9ACTN|nr:phosphopantetheine-binding protein [Micromonospora chaiyaphumensis]SCE89672.1 Phosphopantetheine attachment site [Micromonospora chaiyaphumensis]
MGTHPAPGGASASGTDIPSVEEQITAIWREALDVPPGAEHATFFELGGQSITALLIIAWLEDELGITSVGVDQLFDDPDLDTFIRQVVVTLEPAA